MIIGMGLGILQQVVDKLSNPEPEAKCSHGVMFDYDAYKALSEVDQKNLELIRERWPRMVGNCPKGCGFHGIAYASMLHYICGDW